MTLLIDADWLCYNCSYAVENDDRFDDNLHVLYSRPSWALDLIETYIQRYKEVSEDEGEVLMCFTSYPTFRHDLYQEYKANRKSRRKPLALKAVMDALTKRYRCIRYDGLEGDDVLGILATSKELDDPIIVSPDKDMRTIPCKLLAGEDLELITRRQADRNWMAQALTGDTTDNYKGIAGVGVVTANKILGDTKELPDMWEVVVKEYEKKQGGYKEALLTARLARILRSGDYNTKTGKVKLWKP